MQLTHHTMPHYLKASCQQILRWDSRNHIAIDALAWADAGCFSVYSNQSFDICSAVQREYERLEQVLTSSEVFSFCLNALNTLAEENNIEPLRGNEPFMIIAHEQWELHYQRMVDVQPNPVPWVFNQHATAACSQMISKCINCYTGE